jgi:ketosteroid isomerase-like protein
MPTRDQVETAARTHFEAWNAADHSRWMSIWHPEVITFDPVGGPEKRGPDSIAKMWERAFQPGHSWRLEPVFMSVCGDQAAVHVLSHANLNGDIFKLESIEIYWVGDDGRIARCHTYFTPVEGHALDPYWMNQGS